MASPINNAYFQQTQLGVNPYEDQMSWMDEAPRQDALRELYLDALDPRDRAEEAQRAHTENQQPPSQNTSQLLQNLSDTHSVSDSTQGVLASARDVQQVTSAGSSASSTLASASPAIDGAGKLLAPVAPLLGANQILNASHDKNKVDAGFDVAGGADSIATGAAGTAAAFGSTATVGGLALGTVASGAGGVGAIIDGGHDLYDGIRSGNATQTAGGGIKTVAGGLALAGVATGQPELVLAGGAAYLGALGLEHGKEIGHVASEAWHGATHLASSAAHKVEHVASSAVHGVEHAASGAVDTAKHVAGGAIHAVTSLL